MAALTLEELVHRHDWPLDFARFILESSRELGHVVQDEHGRWHATPELERALGPALRALEPDGGEVVGVTPRSAPLPARLGKVSGSGFPVGADG